MVGGTYREKQVSYVLIEEEVPVASDGESVVHGPAGPGIVPSGQRWLYAEVKAGRTFPKRGLLELVTGPTAPAFLEIESADAFRGHHFEIRTSEFNGKTPEAGS